MFRIAPRSGCLSRNTRLLTLALRACRIPLSRPSRARELKHYSVIRMDGTFESRPSRARELKPRLLCDGVEQDESRPSRARELKPEIGGKVK